MKRIRLFSIILLAAALLYGCGAIVGSDGKEKEKSLPTVTIDPENLQEIYYAGGCFWGVEKYFSQVPGVYEAVSGYANGNMENPTYEQVSSDETGFAETVMVRYDPGIITLRTLTEQFLKMIDPLSVNQQGNDVGIRYRSGIFYENEKELAILNAVMGEAETKYGEPLAVELKPLENFYPAEEVHQDYLQKNPEGYCHVDFSSLEDLIIRSDGTVVTKEHEEELRQKLTPEQFDVTQNAGTESPYSGEYWNQGEAGVYVDVVTGEALFASVDQYDAGCGWPSFTKPITSDSLTERADDSNDMDRTEVRSRWGNSHLGHVFDDGPAEEGGQRYCINSASLRFISFDEMEKEGYGKYLSLFQ